MTSATASKYAWPKRGSTCGKLVALLLDGNAHDYSEMVDALYGEDEDGGPLHVHSVLRLMIKRLRDTGWAIELVRRRTYRLDLDKPLPRDEARPAMRSTAKRHRPEMSGEEHYWWFNSSAKVDWPDHPLHGALVLVKRAPAAYRSYQPGHPQGLDLGSVVVVRPMGAALSGGADFLLPPDKLVPVKAAQGKQPASSETVLRHVSRETCSVVAA